MQSVGVDIVPVFRRVEMSEGIFIVMSGNFRVSAGSRCKEHQHKVVPARSVVRPVVMGAVKCVFLIKRAPALTRAVYYQLMLKLRTACRRYIRLMRRVAVGGADYRRNAGGFEAVLKIVLLKLVCGGYRYRSELMKPQYRVPELVMPFKHQHYAVAFSYA